MKPLTLHVPVLRVLMDLSILCTDIECPHKHTYYWINRPFTFIISSVKFAYDVHIYIVFFGGKTSLTRLLMSTNLIKTRSVSCLIG